MAERDSAVEADTATSRALGAVLAIEMNLPEQKKYSMKSEFNITNLAWHTLPLGFLARSATDRAREKASEKPSENLSQAAKGGLQRKAFPAAV